MKMGAEEKRKRQYLMILGPIAGVLFVYQLWNLFGGGGSTPPPPVVTSAPAKTVGPVKSGPAATRVATSSAQLDPTLHMEPMLVTEGLVYSGSGRNIFSGQVEAPPVEEVKAVAPPRPGLTVAPPPPRPPGPAPLPPINLKFFGTDTAQNGSRRAFLLNGDDVFLASIGDVVQRRYRVVSIAANSIQVEDIPNNNKQTLPLGGN
jgi:hypothetical protein